MRIAIIGGGIAVPLGPGTAQREVVDAYSGHANSIGWASGWFSVVLIGRIIFVVGLRAGLVASGRPQPLLDVAVAAMTAGVVLEVVTYAMTTAAAVLADEGAATTTVLALDRAAFEVNATLFGPTGAAVLCASIGLWRSGLLPGVLTTMGLISGAVLTLAAAALTAPELASAHDAATALVLLVWVWMIWTGVLFWRRSPAPEVVTSVASPTDMRR